jgi:ribose 5-phosphate isomerase B
MKIFIASDHCGFHIKKHLIEGIQDQCSSQKLEIMDLGTNSDNSCDYPIFANRLVASILQNSNVNHSSISDIKSVGILICGTGIGMSICANRNINVRAAVCCNEEMAEMARKHNNANVIALGATVISKESALKIVKKFIETDFDNDERHVRRLNLLNDVKPH